MSLKSRQKAFKPSSLPANQLKTSPSLSLSLCSLSLPLSLSPSLSLPLPFASWKWWDCTMSRGGVKSEAAEGIRRLVLFLADSPERLWTRGSWGTGTGGGRAQRVRNGCAAADARGKSPPAVTSWNPQGPLLCWSGTAQRSLRKQTVSAAEMASSWGYSDASTAWMHVNVSWKVRMWDSGHRVAVSLRCPETRREEMRGINTPEHLH